MKGPEEEQREENENERGTQANSPPGLSLMGP